MEAIIEKIKEYKIIVICTGLGLLVGGFFLLKPAPQTPVKETNLQAEVAAVSKDLVSEKEVNKEEKEELKQVKGLGGKRAQDIIDHREANGKFKSVDELKKVSGIGGKTIEKLKDYVTVD
ncbi:TPA: helix-hairpin-helix domain-containing protein [Streptococcus pneumoniae]